MGDVQEGDANLLLQRFELHLERSPEFRVQRAQRLVPQQHRRPEHQRPGQGHPLLLAAGQLAGAAPGERAELDEVERLVHLALDLLLAELAVAQAEGDVVEHAQEREKRITLKHGVDVLAIRWNEELENAAPEGRTNFSQRFSAGKGRRYASSPGGTTQLSPANHRTSERGSSFVITSASIWFE